MARRVLTPAQKAAKAARAKRRRQARGGATRSRGGKAYTTSELKKGVSRRTARGMARRAGTTVEKLPANVKGTKRKKAVRNSPRSNKKTVVHGRVVSSKSVHRGIDASPAGGKQRTGVKKAKPKAQKSPTVRAAVARDQARRRRKARRRHGIGR